MSELLKRDPGVSYLLVRTVDREPWAVPVLGTSVVHVQGGTYGVYLQGSIGRV